MRFPYNITFSFYDDDVGRSVVTAVYAALRTYIRKTKKFDDVEIDKGHKDRYNTCELYVRVRTTEDVADFIDQVNWACLDLGFMEPQCWME